MIHFDKETRQFNQANPENPSFFNNLSNKANEVGNNIKDKWNNRATKANNFNTKTNYGAVNSAYNNSIGSHTKQTGLIKNSAGKAIGKTTKINYTSAWTGKDITKSTLNNGNLRARLAHNTSGGNIGGKLTAGSKTKIAAWGVGTGLAAGKLGGTLAANRASNKAIKNGLKPGTPEYDAYVKQHKSAGKLAGRVVGGIAGTLGARYLGKNTFKVKK